MKPKPLKPATIKKLLEIKKRILQKPERFVMESFFYQKGGEVFGADVCVYEEPPCGTTACIAGHALVLNERKKSTFRDSVRRLISRLSKPNGFGSIVLATSKTHRLAAEILGITTYQAGRLFYHYKWPEGYKVAYETADSPKERARAAADYIDHIIAHGL